MIKLSELKQLASEADLPSDMDKFDDFLDAIKQAGINAKYIAAANPETVLSLVNEITLLREALVNQKDRLNEIDISMNHSAAMAQEIWRHAVSENKKALADSELRIG